MTDNSDVSPASPVVRNNLSPSCPPDAVPPETYAELCKDYPFALIVSGLGLGMLAGDILPRGLGRKLARGALAASAIAIEAGQNYSSHLVEAADHGRDKLGSLKLGASTYGRHLAGTAGQSAHKGRVSAMNTIGKAIKIVADLRR